MASEGPEVSKAEERGLERLILFSDAVVAIAITLLVLPLTELKPDEGEGVWAFLRSEWDELLAFFISFLVIARFWFVHHALFKNLIRMDQPLLVLNTCWLASVVFLPFPTALLNDHDGYATLYLANLLVTSAFTTALSVYIGRHPRLSDDPAHAARGRGDHLFGAALVGSILLALVASLFWGSTALLLLLLIPIAQRVLDAVSKGRRTSSPQPRSQPSS